MTVKSQEENDAIIATMASISQYIPKYVYRGFLNEATPYHPVVMDDWMTFMYRFIHGELGDPSLTRV